MAHVPIMALFPDYGSFADYGLCVALFQGIFFSGIETVAVFYIACRFNYTSHMETQLHMYCTRRVMARKTVNLFRVMDMA